MVDVTEWDEHIYLTAVRSRSADSERALWERNDAIRDAVKAGISLRKVADAADLSAEGVRKICQR